MVVRRIIALVLGLLVLIPVLLVLLGNPAISRIASEQAGYVHAFGTSI